ncbi:MAG: DUF3267 domain-containing protein [Clostridiaceae bacterium]
MNYAKNIPLTDSTTSKKLSNEGWSKLKEPSSLSAMFLFSLPFMLVNALITGGLIYLLYPPMGELFLSDANFSFTVTLNIFSLVYVVGFIMIHELIHAVFIPNAFRSSKTLWGIIGLGVFIYTTETLSKRRFIMISIMPYMVLSLLLPLVLSILGGLNSYTILLCLINAMGSSVDFLNGYLILVQVPDDALILSNGRETCYRKS